MEIQDFKQHVEKALLLFVAELGEESKLKKACEYALLGKGKRLRPILVLMIADAIGRGCDVLPAALSTEFFHTASLIADDLPCMDNDLERRSRPSLHVAFGEDIAILASYTLIAEGYGGIYKNGKDRPDLVSLSLEAATRCAGIKGATNGQFLDLHPPSYSFEVAKKIVYQKTGTLFEISFIFGWLFGGGEKERLEEVKAAAIHLGMAFQVADDLADVEEDPFSLNMAKILGRKKAQLFFEEEMRYFVSYLKALRLWTPSFQGLVLGLEKTVQPVTS